MVEPSCATKQCDLLALPLEIRRLILNHLSEPFDPVKVAAEAPVFDNETKGSTKLRSPGKEPYAVTYHSLHAQLLSSCKQLYAECLPFLYSYHTFNLTVHESLGLLLWFQQHSSCDPRLGYTMEFRRVFI